MTESIKWKEIRIPIKGNIVRASYSLSWEGLVTVKTQHGTKATHRAGLSAATVAKILLRELTELCRGHAAKSRWAQAAQIG
jgi:hypothetical protein